MKSQAEIGAQLRARLATYATLATLITNRAVTEIDDAGDATKQQLGGLQVMPIVAVIDGTQRHPTLTAQGTYGEFRFDILLYLVGVREDETGINETELDTLMSNLFKQVLEFVEAEGGNTSFWNFISVADDASTDQTKDLADILYAAKLVPLTVTSFQ